VKHHLRGALDTGYSATAMHDCSLAHEQPEVSCIETSMRNVQAASCCGLPQDAAASGQPSNMLSKELPEASDQLIQLACSRLLSATCVKQQIQAIKDQQQDQSAIAAKAQTTPSAVGRAAQQGPLSLKESGADETSTGPTAGSHEHYSRDAAMSDIEAAQDAEEDRQIADATIARLLDKRCAWHNLV